GRQSACDRVSRRRDEHHVTSRAGDARSRAPVSGIGGCIGPSRGSRRLCARRPRPQAAARPRRDRACLRGHDPSRPWLHVVDHRPMKCCARSNWSGTNAEITPILHVAHMSTPGVDVANRVKGASRGVPESALAGRGLRGRPAPARARGGAVGVAGTGGVGVWSVVVALPAVQAEFNVARSAASLPYTMTMICFGFGGILLGRLPDRFPIILPRGGG